MKSALIRPAQPDDSAAIEQVHIDTWRDAYAGILPASYLVHRLKASAHSANLRVGILGGKSQGATLVAEIDRVVGFISYGVARHVREPGTGEIYAFYVDPEAQGQGIGRALLSVALDRMFANGSAAVEVEVLSQNPARHFYTAMEASISGQGIHRFAGRKLPVTYYRWLRPA